MLCQNSLLRKTTAGKCMKGKAGLQMPKGILPRLQSENEIRKEVKKEKKKMEVRVKCFTIKPRWFKLLINRPCYIVLNLGYQKPHHCVKWGRSLWRRRWAPVLKLQPSTKDLWEQAMETHGPKQKSSPCGS